MVSYSVYSFCVRFLLLNILWDSLVVLREVIHNSFLLLYSLPLWQDNAIYFSTLWLMGIWVVPVWGSYEQHYKEHSRIGLWQGMNAHCCREFKILSFSRYYQTVFPSGCTKLYCHLQTMNIKTNTWCFPSWAIVVLICISLEANEAEHIFICFLAIWIFSFENVEVFAHFLLGYQDNSFFAVGCWETLQRSSLV